MVSSSMALPAANASTLIGAKRAAKAPLILRYGAPVRSAAANRGLQPGAGVRPVSIGGRWRNAQDFGRLVACQSRKVAQFDELGFERIGCSQLLQRLVESEKLIIRLGCGDGV